MNLLDALVKEPNFIGREVRIPIALPLIRPGVSREIPARSYKSNPVQHCFDVPREQIDKGDLSKLVYTGERDFYGLDQWLPSQMVTHTPFCRIDRTADWVRLAGWSVWRMDAEETDFELLERAQRELFFYADGQPTHVFRQKAWDEPFFESRLGRMELHQDPDCPPGRSYMLTVPTWKLWTLEVSAKPPHSGPYFGGNLTCTHPGANAVIHGL